MVLHGVDDDQHVPELGGDDPAAVVSGVLRPHNVDLVVAQVSQLPDGGSGRGGRRGGGVEKGLTLAPQRVNSTQKARQ